VVAEDEDVVLLEDALVVARPELVVEVPRGHGADLVLAGRLERLFSQWP
jgi:hypothetical protein